MSAINGDNKLRITQFKLCVFQLNAKKVIIKHRVSTCSPPRIFFKVCRFPYYLNNVPNEPKLLRCGKIYNFFYKTLI